MDGTGGTGGVVVRARTLPLPLSCVCPRPFIWPPLNIIPARDACALRARRRDLRRLERVLSGSSVIFCEPFEKREPPRGRGLTSRETGEDRGRRVDRRREGCVSSAGGMLSEEAAWTLPGGDVVTGIVPMVSEALCGSMPVV